MAGPTKFDSASFKQSTRDQWDHAAEAWNRWGSLLEQWCGEHTAKMLDMAGVQLGHRVVDIAAGGAGRVLLLPCESGRKVTCWRRIFLPRFWHTRSKTLAHLG